MNNLPKQKLVFYRYCVDGVDQYYAEDDADRPTGEPDETIVFEVRAYSFGEQLQAETEATEVSFEGVTSINQEKYANALLRLVLGEAQVERMMQLPYWIGRRVWDTVGLLSLPPNLTRWRPSSSKSTESGKEAPSTPRTRRTR